MSGEAYSLSFTSGALLYSESITVAELYADLREWDHVRQVVIDENRLQMRTLNSSKRIYQEVASRLKTLRNEELDALLDFTLQERRYLLWLAICRRYRFIHEFAVEVLREKFLRLDPLISPAEYDRFFDAKAEWHPEMDEIRESTRGKQRQIVFKMLREADLITKENAILPAILSPQMIALIGRNAPQDLAIYPIGDLQVSHK